MAYNPLEVAGPEDYPVKVGSMLLTLVDPHKGFEKAYNRWYERDHFYGGCMEGRYQIAGSRWVATREMKDLRWPKGDKVANPVDAGSYVAIYWTLAGHHQEWDDWSMVQVKDLYESGRGFPERSHVHTATFDYIGVDYRDPDGVPLTLALDHKYDAIIAVWIDGRDGRDAAATHADLSKELLPELLEGSTLDIAASWVPSEGFRGSGRSGQPDGARHSRRRRQPAVPALLLRGRRPYPARSDAQVHRRRREGRHRRRAAGGAVPAHRARHRHVRRPDLVNPSR